MAVGRQDPVIQDSMVAEWWSLVEESLGIVGLSILGSTSELEWLVGV